MVYSYENETFYMKNMYEHFGKDDYCGYFFPDKTVTFARMNPVLVIIREIDLYFEKYNMPQIGTIEVDTQDKETIIITIHTGNPGRLIGSYGKNIDYFNNRLSEIFNKKTQTNIVEIKNDINEPIYTGY
jgi:ribosomal protein S3